jgi:hypothetical protein
MEASCSEMQVARIVDVTEEMLDGDLGFYGGDVEEFFTHFRTILGYRYQSFVSFI